MPRHYVQRPEHFEAVKAMLLDENEGTPGTLVISAIYGMGGIGKSVLAAALVQSGEIQRRFPDGVLWVTLGQQPDMLSMVNLWIRELGDYDYNPTTLQAASLHLRTLLADKKALLVIDDVWHPEHVEPFRIGGAGCCVLVTTRQTKIVGATRYDVDLMTPQQSLELLTRCLLTPLFDAEQSSAETFANEVGYLPLALELAAAQIEDGMSWDELLEAFQAEMADPEALDIDSDVESISDEAIRKRRSLVASFKLTLKLLSREQLKQFAWLGIVPEDVSLTQPMAATLWGVSPVQASKLLREFKNRALLLSQAQRSGEKPTYRIHDLVHDLAKNLLTHEQYLGDLPGLGLTVEEAHSQFLERYRVQTQNDLWHTVPADGYIHSHLAWHFEQAGQPELMHQLLKESTPDGRNGWYEACEKLGQTASFVTDVARAWQAAEGLYTQNAPESIALQCRYALITTSLNSLAQNIPPELIAAFVQKGFWTPAQGLSYVRQILNPNAQARNFRALAPFLPKGLISEALIIARTMQSEGARGSALSALVPYVPEVVSEALVVLHKIQDEVSRATALIALVPYLPELVSEAMEGIGLIRSDPRSFVLRDLAPYVPEELMGEMLAIACTNRPEHYQAQGLTLLAQYLPEAIMSEALAMACSIQKESYRAKALSELAPYLSKTLMSEVLPMTRSIQNKFDRAKVLIRLVQHMPELMNEALAVARSIQDETSRAKILSELAQYTPELVDEALAVARLIEFGPDRVKVLSSLVQYRPELVGEVLAMARLVQTNNAWIHAVRELAPYLPEVLMRESLVMARSLQRECDRTLLLRGVTEHLPTTLMSEALTVARSLQDEPAQAIALSEFSQYMPELVSEILVITHNIQDDYERSRVLIKLAQYMPKTLVNEFLTVAHSIQNVSCRAHALSSAAQYMHDEVISEALSAVRLIQDVSKRANALSELAEHIPRALMNESLEVARSISITVYQASALGALAQQWPDLVGEALTVARSIPEWVNCDDALIKLAQYWPEEFMSKALSAAHRIHVESERADALIRLAKYVPQALMNEALEVTRSIKEDRYRAYALSWLAQCRVELLDEVLMVARSVQQASDQAEVYSWLACQYRPELISEALEVIGSIHNESTRATSLKKLVQKYFQYKPEIMREVLKMVRSIQQESIRGNTLIGLAQYWPENLISEVLEVFQTIQDESIRAKVSSKGLLPVKLKLIGTDIASWKEVLHINAHEGRQAFLKNLPKLAPAMITLSGEDKTVLNLVVDEMRNVCRQWP
ncbi:NB-ARC domain-containing protein [Leptothoe sp. EHU-05/26/07-4]